jgi:hypothetical protein
MTMGFPLRRARGRFALAVLLVSVALVLAPEHDAAAQQGQGQGQYVTEASARLGKLIGKANQDGFVLQSNNFSIGGGWLKQDQNTWVPLFTVSLQAGKKYRFLAAGDNDAKDVDLQVLDGNGKVVAVDDAADPEAVVDYTPAATQKYLVRVRLFDSATNVDCACLAVVMTAK